MPQRRMIKDETQKLVSVRPISNGHVLPLPFFRRGSIRSSSHPSPNGSRAVPFFRSSGISSSTLLKVQPAHTRASVPLSRSCKRSSPLYHSGNLRTPTTSVPLIGCAVTSESSNGCDRLSPHSLSATFMVAENVQRSTATRNKTSSCASSPRKACYIVGTMRHCGTIYEAMARELVATGYWKQVSVRQQPVLKTLVVTELQAPLTHTNVHLLLGEKIPTERVIATRRNLAKMPHHARGVAPIHPSYRKMDGCGGCSQGLGSGSMRMPMGCGSDGLPRVVDFIENTRCITLKGSMVATMRCHHGSGCDSTGGYLPLTYQIYPRKPHRDERHLLGATCRSGIRTGDDVKLWIAKSSSGSHGENIKIFSGDAAGIRRMLSFIDNQAADYSWVAQQYIGRPLLYHKRKFDVRCWVLLLLDSYEIYIYNDLVMRLSSIPYSIESATSKSQDGKLAHITNHCLQATSEEYSAFEDGNELWKEHLDGLVRYTGKRILERARVKPGREVTHSGKRDGETLPPLLGPIPFLERLKEISFPAARAAASPTLHNTITPQFRHIVVDTLLAARPHIPKDTSPPPTHCFQVFGYDFLIDETLKVWLLEINGAPGASVSLIPSLVRDVIDLAVAPLFPHMYEDSKRDGNQFEKVYPH